MATEKKYAFSWNLVGDIELGRPHLGKYTRLEVYRVMQFTFRDAIEKKYGTQVADEIFYEAGKIAGAAFYQQFITPTEDVNDFLRQVQTALKDLSIGLLRVEKADVEYSQFTLTVAEDLDCSGLPELGFEVCVYDEGFIAAVFESQFGRKFNVKEIDCWCTGGRICRFDARPEE